MDRPSVANNYQRAHADLLIASYRKWTGRDLVCPEGDESKRAHALFTAPFAVVSHGVDSDPVFNYGNCTALQLFELSWQQFVKLPSRRSAEPLERSERERLLAAVSTQGYIDDYNGVRISATGTRFRIEQATVWNLVDEDGLHCGQAACFATWTML
jgi:hypothetical protein